MWCLIVSIPDLCLLSYYDEDDDGMYDGASGLKVFILYLKFFVTSLILFSKQQFIPNIRDQFQT